mgnify:CR=1 FL=1
MDTLDLGPIAARTTNEVVGRHHSLSMRNVMAEPICLEDIDLHTFEASKAERAMHASCTFETSRAGKVNALAGWFEADFGCGTMLTNGPSAPRTHWGVARFPLYQTVAIKHGSKSADIGKRHVKADYSVGKQPIDIFSFKPA